MSTYKTSPVSLYVQCAAVSLLLLTGCKTASEPSPAPSAEAPATKEPSTATEQAAPAPGKNQASSEDRADAEFDPCKLEKVWACLRQNAKGPITCDAHRGYFMVVNDVIGKNTKLHEQAKSSCQGPRSRFIDNALCPTTDIHTTFVTWSVPNRGQPQHTQIGYQVIYQQNAASIAEPAKSLFAVHAKYPKKRVFQCDANGKVVAEL